MNSFKHHMQECLDGEAPILTIPGLARALNFQDPQDRDSVNSVLLGLVELPGNSDMVYERVRIFLRDYGYELPPAASLDFFKEDSGEHVFGLGTGSTMVFLYFAFTVDPIEGSECLAEVVTEEELEDLLSDDIP